MEYFQALFSANHNPQKSEILCILQQAVKIELDELPITEETSKTIEQLKSGKTEIDRIPEIWKYRGAKIVYKSLHAVAGNRTKSQDFHDAVIIITQYKNKSLSATITEELLCSSSKE